MTFQVAEINKISYFDVLEQDIEFVIMFINFLVEKAEDEKDKDDVIPLNNNKQPQRVRVNDDTASGGWW